MFQGLEYVFFSKMGEGLCSKAALQGHTQGLGGKGGGSKNAEVF